MRLWHDGQHARAIARSRAQGTRETRDPHLSTLHTAVPLSAVALTPRSRLKPAGGIIVFGVSPSVTVDDLIVARELSAG